MSEYNPAPRNSARFNTVPNAQERSPEEQRRLMEEYDTARYESVFGTEEGGKAFDEAMNAREHEALMQTEERIMGDVESRRMYLLSQQVAELRKKGGEPEIIADKEAKLVELLDEYTRKAEADRDAAVHADKEAVADAEYAKRMEVADFLVNSTDPEWVSEKMAITTEADNLDKLDPVDKENIEKLGEFIQNNPDSPESARLREQIEDLKRQIQDTLDGSGQKEKSPDSVTELGEAPEPSAGDNASKERDPRDDENSSPEEDPLGSDRPTRPPRELGPLGDSDRGWFDDLDDDGFDDNWRPATPPWMNDREATDPRQPENGRLADVPRRAFVEMNPIMIRERLAGLRERFRDKKVSTTVIALGIAATSAAVAWLALKQGDHDTVRSLTDLNDGSSGGGKGHTGPKSVEAFSPAARQVHSGEGWNQQLTQMGIPKSEQGEVKRRLLESDNPLLKRWVYRMKDGQPGIERQGKIPTAVLKLVQSLRNK